MGQQPNWDQLQENMQKVLGDSYAKGATKKISLNRRI
jgi:hypothetical protein